MNKHTPGPWMLAESVEGKHTKTNLRRIRSEREGLEHGAVCEVYGIADGSDAHANASLIAAAPDMLEALQALIACDFGANGWSETAEQAAIKARAAVLKATGGKK